MRTSDLATRLGGDEFGLLLPETGFEEAEVFIGRLRQNLDDEVDRTYWPLGYSAGVVTFTTPPENLKRMPLDNFRSVAMMTPGRLFFEASGITWITA